MGVRRALNLCLDAANSPLSARPISTLGPLIHNRQVLEVLQQKGVRIIDNYTCEEDIGTAIIRAHGILPERLDRLKESAERVIDATCPHVSKVQNIVRKYSALGYKCIVVGDPGHAEVEGVMSYAGGAGIVVSGLEDAEKLGDMERAVVVAQTTQNESVFNAAADIVCRKCFECKVFNTICKATQERQDEATELAKNVEAMVVVGGYNSANTRRLAQICSRTGTPVFHVESDEELDVDEILRFRRIAITAGASTPNWMIRRVTARLARCEQQRNHSVWYLLKRLLNVPVRTNAFLGGGAAMMTYAAFSLLELPFGRLLLCMALAFCFITSQHLLHQHTKLKAMLLNEPERGRFFRAHAVPLQIFAAVMAAMALAVSIFLGVAPFLLVLLGTAGGLVYSMPERRAPFLGAIGRFRQITGSKEFFVALAWAITTVLIPYLASGSPQGRFAAMAAFALFAALLAFYRTLLTDIRDVEGDQLVGRETIAVAFGRKTVARILLLIAPVQLVLLSGLLLFGWISGGAYVMLLVPCYCMMIAVLSLRNRLPAEEAGEALTDAVFYLAGIIAFYLSFGFA